jgi:ribonuclease VapC
VKRITLLDASALLALVLDERGADRIEALLESSAIHAVNFAEVIAKLLQKGIPADEAGQVAEELALDVYEDFGSLQAVSCGELHASTRPLGLGLGDCVCLTVAAWRGMTAVTCDRKWLDLQGRSLPGTSTRLQVECVR